MTTALFDKVDELLPHSGEILLITGIVSRGDDCASVYVQQDGTSVFADDDGNVPAWVGVEYMAQAIGVYAGMDARLKQRPIRPGFLLGTRRYTAHTDSFLKDTRLDIRVEAQLYEENGIALFDCSIRTDGQLLAQADVKVIQPDDVEELLRGNES